MRTSLVCSAVNDWGLTGWALYFALLPVVVRSLRRLSAKEMTGVRSWAEAGGRTKSVTRVGLPAVEAGGESLSLSESVSLASEMLNGFTLVPRSVAVVVVVSVNSLEWSDGVGDGLTMRGMVKIGMRRVKGAGGAREAKIR